MWNLLQIQDAVPKTSLRSVLVTCRLPQSPAVCMEDGICLQTAPWALCKTEIGTSKWKLCFNAPTKTSEKAQLLLVRANVLRFRSASHLFVSLWLRQRAASVCQHFPWRLLATVATCLQPPATTYEPGFPSDWRLPGSSLTGLYACETGAVNMTILDLYL